jgi:hypothetical protein
MARPDTQACVTNGGGPSWTVSGSPCAVGDLDVFFNDALRIGEIVRRDPSFRSVDTGLLSEAEKNLFKAATQGAFCLDATRLMALAGNGHTQVIANRTARVTPIRFVWLADGPIGSVPRSSPHGGKRSGNGRGVQSAASTSLWNCAASACTRRIMFAWPTAIVMATGRQSPKSARERA